MNYDPYMRNRSGLINGVSNVNISPYLDNSNKCIPIRPPAPQNNYVINNNPVQNFQQNRTDIGRPNSSVNLFMNDFRKISQQSQSPSPNGIICKPQPNYSQNYVTFHPSRHQLPDQQKYICYSPLKNNNRTSVGLIGQDAQQQRFQHRRSDSITQLKPQEINNINYGATSLRQTIDCPSPTNSKYSTTSPFQVNYTNSVNSVNSLSETRSRISQKDPIDTISFTYKDQQKNGVSKLGYSVRRPQKVATYFEGSNLQKNNQTFQGDLDRKRYLDNNNSQMRPSEESNYKKMGISSATTENFMRKDSNQDLASKKYSNGRISEIDKSIEKDIELLKFTSRKTEEILERELSKNNYLNNFFEQKGLRPKAEEKITQQTYQNKQQVAKNTFFQNEIESKNKQIFEKNKELVNKSNSIIQKNRQLQIITSEYQQKKKQFQKRQSQWFQKQKLFQQKLIHLQKQLIQRAQIYNNIEVSSFQKITQQQKHIQSAKTQIQQQQIQITNLTGKTQKLQIQIQKIKEQNKQLVKLKCQFQQNNSKYLQEIQQLTSQKQLLLKNIQQKNRISQQKITKYQQKLKIYENKIAELDANSMHLNNKIYEYERQFLKNQNSEQEHSFNNQNTGNENQRLNTAQTEIIQLCQERDSLNAKLSDLKFKYQQISKKMQMDQGYDHQKLLIRINECLQAQIKVQQIQTKQLAKGQQHQVIRIQQEHFQRRHQELNRQLKRVGNRLAGASSEAQQSWRLLRDLNQQIVVSQLCMLNQKYKIVMESE